MPKTNIAHVLDALEQPKKQAPAVKEPRKSIKHGTMEKINHGPTAEQKQKVFIVAQTEAWKRDWWVGEARKKGLRINRIIFDALVRELGEPEQP